MNAEALPKQPSEGESDDIKPIHPAQPPSEEDGQNPQTQNKDNQLIDVSALVVNQTYSEGVIGGHKIFKIKERKPTKHEWFRVNPEPDYKQMLSGFVYECGGEKVTYLANEVHRDADLAPPPTQRSSCDGAAAKLTRSSNARGLRGQRALPHEWRRF